MREIVIRIVKGLLTVNASGHFFAGNLIAGGARGARNLIHADESNQADDQADRQDLGTGDQVADLLTFFHR